MSRRTRTPRQRRAHKARRHERRAKRLAEMPSAPTRLNFFGFSRRGDAAKLSLNFSGPELPLTPEDLDTGDPTEALRSALLRQAWSEGEHQTQGEG